MSSTLNMTRIPICVGGSILELDVARHQWASTRPEFSKDPETLFNSRLSSFNGVLNVVDNPVPSTLSYKILNDGLSILLQPIVLNNNLNISFKSIKINLPDRILPNCFIINSFILNDQTYIITDSITESGLLITTTFELSHFVQQSSKSKTLSSNNYEDWCRISDPYGFNIRKPHLLYSYSYDYSVVLLKDGGIIGLKKDIKDSSFEPVIFNDSSYFESLGHLFKPWVKRPKFNGDSNLSEKATIDIIHFNDYLLTITINRKLRIWSVSTQNLILEKDLTELSSISSNKPFFDSNPSKFLDVLSLPSKGEVVHYLSIYFPFGEGFFKLFKFQSSPSFDIQDLGKDFEFNSNIKESTIIWSLGDFKLTHAENNIELWTLWKSNTSSIIKSLQISQTNQNYSWNTVYQPSISFDRKSINETSTEFYHRKIFQSGIYNKFIIEAALPIFETHFSQILNHSENELHKNISEDDSSLVEKVSKAIGRAIQFDKNYELNLEKQWSRFDTLCQEFAKQADEPLALYSGGDIVLLSNRLEFSLVRPLTNIESNRYVDPSQESFNALIKFSQTIHQFRETLGREILDQVKNSLRLLENSNSESQIKRFTLLYDEYLKDKFNENNLGTLVSQLSEFHDILGLIKSLLDIQQGDQDDELFVKSKLTSISTEATVQSIKNVIKESSKTLLDVVVVLLVLEFEDKETLSAIIAQILKLSKNIFIVEESFDINFDSSTHKLEADEPAQVGNNLFSKVLSSKYPSGFQFNNSQLLRFINRSILPFIHSEEFFVILSVQLISEGHSGILYYKFNQFFNKTPIHQLLKAVTLFNTNQSLKASNIFISGSSLISNHKLTSNQKETLSPLKEYLVFFNSNLSIYYLNLAILFLNNLRFADALKLAELSIQTSVNIESNTKNNELRYHTYITIAIELSSFDIVADSLKKIDDIKLKEECLNNFIYKLCKTSNTKALIDYDFPKDSLKIDELLLKKAQTSEKGFERALFFYKVLHAYRLNLKNYSGAVEALFEFIFNYKHVKELKLVIADFYVIILNLLATFEQDDQWVYFKVNETENDVLSYSELEEQFRTFINTFTKEERSKYDY